MIKNKNYISSEAKVLHNVTLEAPVKLYGNARVNRECFIGAFTYIESRTTIFPRTTIGRYCSIGKNNQIGVIAHPIQWLSTSPIQYNMAYHFPDYANNFSQKKFERPVETIIGNDVWIGSMSSIKRGIHIADGVIIATGAAVTKDVPPYAIVGGVPAKIIRYRFSPEIIRKLLVLQWWKLPYKKLSGIDFDDINKAILQLEKVKKKISKNQKVWICRQDGKSKQIEKNILDKYLKLGWKRGRKFS